MEKLKNKYNINQLKKSYKIYTTKDGRPFVIVEVDKKEYSYIFHKFFAFDADLNEIGFISFCIEKRKTIVLNIVVKDDAYVGQGVGYSLLTECENVSRAEGSKKIEGVFAPSRKVSIVKEFYNRNGFVFTDENKEDPIISKDLKPIKQHSKFKNHKNDGVVSTQNTPSR